MDEEEREALEMTREELLARATRGKRARVAKKPPRRLRGRLDPNAAPPPVIDGAPKRTAG